MCVIFTTLDVFLLDYCWNVLHDLPKPKLILVHPAVSPARRPRQIMNMEQCHCRILRRSLRKKLSFRTEDYFKSLTGSTKQYNLSQVPWMNKVNKCSKLIKWWLLSTSQKDRAKFIYLWLPYWSPMTVKTLFASEWCNVPMFYACI